MEKKERKDYLLDFIENTSIKSLPPEVIEQARKCFLDLTAALCAGAKNNSSKKAATYVSHYLNGGEATVLSTGERASIIGAALANGMAANALDLDDGYSLLRGHPGSGFFGALLTAAEYSHCTYGEFLSALVVCYETSIRQGYAIRDYYGWDHSTGSYSTFGAAAGIGKLLKLPRKQLEMALGIADFIAPVNPAKRSCYEPSMNKDGVYWGQHAGMQAVLMAKSGLTGKNPVILDDKYENLLLTLGEKYYLFDLYIKFYSCCRWVHSPIRAVNALMKEYGISQSDIVNVNIYSFGNAGTLYMLPPNNEDEAQYNIKYPIAAQIVFGDCGPLESSTSKMLDERIPAVMSKIVFHKEPEYDKVFPEKRLSRAEITTNDGRTFVSDEYEPTGDINKNVQIDDIIAKFYKINLPYSDKATCEAVVASILRTSMDDSFISIFESIKNLARKNDNPALEFI